MRYLTEPEFETIVAPLRERLGAEFTVSRALVAGPCEHGPGYVFYAAVSHSRGNKWVATVLETLTLSADSYSDLERTIREAFL